MNSDSLLQTDTAPRVVGALPFNNKSGAGFDFPLHRHEDFCELLLIGKGRGTFTIDGKAYSAGPRTMLCYNQGVWHEEHSDRNEPFQALYVAAGGIRIVSLPINHLTAPGLPPVISLDDHYFAMEERMSEIIREFLDDKPESGTAANFLLGALLVQLIRIVHYKPSAAGRKQDASASVVTTVKRVIHNHYRDGISLSLLAKAAFASPFYLCRLFKRETGMTPGQYWIHFRIEVAKRYLTTTKHTVAHIADLVGYRSETHFQNVFKKITGQSPGKYRSSADRTDSLL